MGNMAKSVAVLQRCSEKSPITIDGIELLYNHYENFRNEKFRLWKNHSNSGLLVMFNNYLIYTFCVFWGSVLLNFCLF